MLKNKNNKNLLLHSCCAPCAVRVALMLDKKYKLTLFFYNPNIHPEYEYKKRLEELKKFSKERKFNLVVGDYDTADWFDKTIEHAGDYERGERCSICYSKRLENTAKYAKNNNFDIWGTTLTISPHKSAEVINCIGKNFEIEYGIKFLESDFKKKDGFKKSLELSWQYNFYRQNYCGCLYSQLK
ncbi:MAG: epoxyqueuosine reductase QueH [bacterium]